MNNKKGFTLIELLVVVAIIGLLAAMSVIALNSARAKARDSKRVGDIKQIQTALELYYNDNGRYPAAVATGGNISSGSAMYMSQVPGNPQPSSDGTCAGGITSYTYATDTNGATYTITYCLGGVTGGLTAGPATATPAGLR